MATKKIPVFLSFQDCETDTDGLYGRAICTQYNLFKVDAQEKSRVFSTQVTTGYECYSEAFEHLMKKVDSESKGKECRLFLIYFNASFDIQRMIEALPNRDFHINLIHSKSLTTKIIFTEYPNIEVEVRDLMLLSPTSLATFTASFAPNIQKLKRKFSFDVKSFDCDDPDDIAYAVRDVDSMTEAFFNAAIELDFNFDRPPLTTPSLAMKKQKEFYREQFGHEWRGLSRPDNESHKKFCHGGRNLIGAKMELDREIPCFCIDIVSAYVASMSQDYYPKAAQTPTLLKNPPLIHNPKSRFLISIFVHDYHPPHYSMLPNEKGVYATGSFITHITDLEYYALIKYHKKYYFNLEFLQVIYWDEIKCAQIMKSYSDYYYSVKQLGDEMNNLVKNSGDSKRAVGKLMGNSLFGKMIQRYYDEKEIFVVSKNAETTSYVQEEKEKKDFGDNRFYAIGALITGAIRASLYHCIEHYGSENLINGDTDSLKFRVEAKQRKPYKKIGTGLGCYKEEYQSSNTRIIVHAPKCYCLALPRSDLTESELKKWDLLDTKTAFKVVVKGIVRRNSLQGDKQLSLDLYNSMLHNQKLVVKYKRTANTLKRYIKDKNLGYTLERELTRRENVNGYRYNEEKKYYELPILTTDIENEHDRSD